MDNQTTVNSDNKKLLMNYWEVFTNLIIIFKLRIDIWIDSYFIRKYVQEMETLEKYGSLFQKQIDDLEKNHEILSIQKTQREEKIHSLKEDFDPVLFRNVYRILFLLFLILGYSMIFLVSRYDEKKSNPNTVVNYSKLLQGNVIEMLKVNGDNLFVGTRNGGLFVRNEKKWSQYTMANSTLRSDQVKDVFYRPEKEEYWVACNRGGLSRFFEGKWRVFDNFSGTKANLIHSVSGNSEDVFVGTEKGLMVYQDNLWKLITHLLGEELGNVFSVNYFQDKLWILCDKGLFEMEKGQEKKLFDEPVKIFGKTADLYAVSDKISGLHCNNGKQWIHYTQKDGLLSNRVNCIVPIEQRILMVGTDKGVNLLTVEGIFQLKIQGLNNIPIYSAAIDGEKIYLGTEHDGIITFYISEMKFHAYSAREKIHSIAIKSYSTIPVKCSPNDYLIGVKKLYDNVYAVCDYSIHLLNNNDSNNLLGENDKLKGNEIRNVFSLATPEKAFLTLSGGTAIFDLQNSRNSLKILENHPDPLAVNALVNYKGTYFVGSEGYGLIPLKENFTFNSETSKSGMPKNVFCLTVYNNNLILGTEEGLWIYDGKDYKKYLSNYFSGKVNSLYVDDKYNNLWVGTDKKGVLLINGEFHRFFNSLKVLDSNRIVAVEKAENNIVILTETGIILYAGTDGFFRLKIPGEVRKYLDCTYYKDTDQLFVASQDRNIIVINGFSKIHTVK